MKFNIDAIIYIITLCLFSIDTEAVKCRGIKGALKYSKKQYNRNGGNQPRNVLGSTPFFTQPHCLQKCKEVEYSKNCQDLCSNIDVCLGQFEPSIDYPDPKAKVPKACNGLSGFILPYLLPNKVQRSAVKGFGLWTGGIKTSEYGRKNGFWTLESNWISQLFMKLQRDHDDTDKLKNDIFAGCMVPLWNIVSAEFVKKMTVETKQIHIFFSVFKPSSVLPMIEIPTILRLWAQDANTKGPSNSFILHPLNYDAITNTKDLHSMFDQVPDNVKNSVQFKKVRTWEWGNIKGWIVPVNRINAIVPSQTITKDTSVKSVYEVFKKIICGWYGDVNEKPRMLTERKDNKYNGRKNSKYIRSDLNDGDSCGVGT
eukprot:Pgem_evm1s5103